MVTWLYKYDLDIQQGLSKVDSLYPATTVFSKLSIIKPIVKNNTLDTEVQYH
jgi:hypothetical protein